MSTEEVLSLLVEGNSRYMADFTKGAKRDSGERSNLIKGQNPFAVVLSCADSRVVPELIFDTGIGELFVVRVAGNVANTSTVASIEYAVEHLNTGLIVVLGHQNCGAVTAAIKGGDNGKNINYLLSHVAPAIKASDKNTPLNDVVKTNAKHTAKQLLNNSEIIKDAVSGNKLKIVSSYYNLESGKVEFL